MASHRMLIISIETQIYLGLLCPTLVIIVKHKLESLAQIGFDQLLSEVTLYESSGMYVCMYYMDV